MKQNKAERREKYEDKSMKTNMFTVQTADQIDKVFDTITKCDDFVGFELLSNPSKMPEKAFNIPADKCKAGSNMVGLEDHICHECYATTGKYKDRKFLSNRGGRYKLDVVQNSLNNRFNFATMNPYFVAVMSYKITKQIKKKFRWFDSGDIQSELMLDNICKVARNTPHIKHWLPTKEWKLVERYITSGHKIPGNLCIRLSALKKNGKPTTKLARKLGLVTSTVVTPDVYDKLSFKCPSSQQKNQCVDCEACWSNKVKDVPYKYHR
jgi:hypothetical protein